MGANYFAICILGGLLTSCLQQVVTQMWQINFDTELDLIAGELHMRFISMSAFGGGRLQSVVYRENY